MTTLLNAYTKKYPTYVSLAQSRFQEANGCEFSWENLTKANLANYVDFLNEKVAPSSVKIYAGMLKAVMSLYDDEHEFPKGWKDILTTKSDTSQPNFHTPKKLSNFFLSKMLYKTCQNKPYSSKIGTE